jgi:integral membrane sensor domain MASE1
MQKKVLFLLFDNLLVVLAYYFAAHLSVSFLSAPPSYASAIWPPSGISLAAVLLKGYRILPAIFIADLIIAIELVGFADFIGITFSLMGGFQAMITAWIGASLINRFLGANNPLIDNKSIGLFFLLGGPVSMVLPSAFALGVEYWLGMIKGSEFLLGVVTWWLGGSIGTIIFAPITLIIFGGGLSEQELPPLLFP